MESSSHFDSTNTSTSTSTSTAATAARAHEPRELYEPHAVVHTTSIKPALKQQQHHNDDDDESMDDDNSNNNNDSNNNTNCKPRATKKKKKKIRTSTKRTTLKLKWDEDKIREHDRLRGTRMKIEEANTPFAYYDSGSETDGSFNSVARGGGGGGSGRNSKRNNDNTDNGGISWDALTNKLEAHAAVKDKISFHNTNSSPSCSSGHTTDEDTIGNAIANTNNTAATSTNTSTNTSTSTTAMQHQQHNTDCNYEHANRQRELERQELKRLEFQEHRKRHYNEMEVLRRFRRDHPGGEPTANGTNHSDDGNDDDDDGSE